MNVPVTNGIRVSCPVSPRRPSSRDLLASGHVARCDDEETVGNLKANSRSAKMNRGTIHDDDRNGAVPCVIRHVGRNPFVDRLLLSALKIRHTGAISQRPNPSRCWPVENRPSAVGTIMTRGSTRGNRRFCPLSSRSGNGRSHHFPHSQVKNPEAH